MRQPEEVHEVASLLDRNLSIAEVVRLTGIPRSTIRNWRDGRTRTLEFAGDACPQCGQRCLPVAPEASSAYAYLLGQYLGDGGIYEHRRSVFRLVVFGDAKYREIAAEVARAISTVAPHVSVSHHLRNRDRTCIATSAYSKAWPCLFPQHGRGHKHMRKIELTAWQRELTHAHPRSLIRGLLQSDGCRAFNTVRSKGRTYRYPRYQFSNRSTDIQAIFCQHLDLLEVPWRQMNRWTISVARRDAVARLDEFVGPKN